MEFRDNPAQAAFREEVRAFLREHLPDALRGGLTLRAAFDGRGYRERRNDSSNAWRAALLARRWVAPAWPREHGGAGMSTLQQFVLNEEMARARAPRIGGMGLGLAGPTILLYGTDEQKAAHLRRILSGEERWCQGFSEPGAGSDLAALQTRAVRAGDDYVVNGQKIWTSGARGADWMMLLARTDPDAPKHKGISYLLVDMRTPGITVRPLPNMVGDADFNEVFFEDVRVPARHLLGEENRGWYVGTATLDIERSNIAGSTSLVLMAQDLLEIVRTGPGLPQAPARRDAGLRLESADRFVEAQIARLMSYRVAWAQRAGVSSNREASVAKLFTSELEQRIARTALRALGPYGQVLGEGAPVEGKIPRMYLGAVSTTIGGGTSEIQRNIIAMRGLGLPRD